MKIVLISGASSGIGQAIAARFLQAGDRVINLSRRPCPVPGVATVPCDLAVPGAAEDLAPILVPLIQDAGGLCLVHNAAAMRQDRVSDLTATDLRAVLELNLVAPQALNRICLPHMPAGSSILYIGSTLAEKAVPGVASYVVSKHGLAGLMRATCQDLAGTGIHTCMICPGFTDTPPIRALINGNPDTLAAITGLSAFGRLIEPEEIAEAVFFAAGAPVLNGALIHANLGQRER